MVSTAAVLEMIAAVGGLEARGSLSGSVLPFFIYRCLQTEGS